MRRCFVCLAALGLAVSAFPMAARAQLAANPVYYAPKLPHGLTVALDYGATVKTKENGITPSPSVKPTTFGARAILGLPLVDIGVGGGIYDPDVTGVDNAKQLMATLALRLFSPPLVPVGIALQGGAGYAKVGTTKRYSIPIGVALSVKPPTPGLSFEPWIAPRLQLTGTNEGSGLGSAVQAGIGASGGFNLGLPTGLGLHAALDWTRLPAKTSGTLALPKAETLIFGIGLHYTFTIPGIPLVPMI